MASLMSPELTDAEKIALATAFGADDVTSMKRRLPDGSSHVIDCVLRVTGGVAKTFGKKGATTTQPAEVVLTGPRFLAAVIASLGIKSEQFDAAVRAVAATAVKDGVLAIGDAQFPESDVVSATLEAVTVEVANKLPTREVESGAKSGSVSSSITVEHFVIGATELAAAATAPAAVEAATKEAAEKPAKAKATRRKASP